MTVARTPVRKPSETRRDEVVVVVLDLLANGGVSAVTTPAIARRIGIAQSALFKHFPNKEAIWRAVMETIALEVGARLAGAAAESGTHEERIFAILAAYLSAVIDIPAIPALLFSGEVQTPGRASYLRTEISKRFGWFHAALRDQLFVGQRSGAFRRDFDPDAAASLAAGIAQSAVLRWRLGGGEVDMIAEAHRAFPLFLAAIERHQGV